jgi:CheY-like chemotaxis protein
VRLPGEAAAALTSVLGEAPVDLERLEEWEAVEARLATGICDGLVVGAADAARAMAALPPESHTALAVYAPEEPGSDLARDLRRQAEVRGVRVAQSVERLIDDVALLTHLRASDLPAAARDTLERLYRGEAMLAGRKVLIVDDDIRNIFAMTSLLETHKMQVVAAETGKDGIEKLQSTPGIDIVLMDIMMPDMDGYDTMRAIRGIPAFRSLPIVAVTAKAMRGDREKCIEAGAWDYLPKPVASDQLLSVFRTWLHR